MMPKRTTWFQCTKKHTAEHASSDELLELVWRTAHQLCNWTYELLIYEGIIGVLALPRLNPVRSYNVKLRLRF